MGHRNGPNNTSLKRRRVKRSKYETQPEAPLTSIAQKIEVAMKTKLSAFVVFAHLCTRTKCFLSLILVSISFQNAIHDIA